MCDCFHLAFPNWHAASSGTGAGRRLRAPEPGTEDDSTCDEPSQFTEGERPRPQGSSPVEEYPETEKYTDSDKECEAEHDPHHKSGSGKKTKKSGLGSMFEKRSTPKMSKLKEVPSPESGVIVKTAKDGCAEGLVYGGGGKEGIFIKEVVPESPASKSLKLKEGDQILSATVYFDNVSYEDAIQILEHAQAYKVKLCLKRKPDITETEPAIESDVIPEDNLYAPEMREPGKTKRRGDARISWPKFPSFGKGRKSRFTRSHSSSEADEQRKLELSPTTSDTDSPIKSQDALKGKKKHRIKLSGLTKRGRISSSEDQDTDAPTSGQISGNILQTHDASDMLSPECLESPSGETPEVYVTEDLKVVEDLRLQKNDQKLTEPQIVQHKVELITIGSTLKTEDLTVALADQESPSGIKSPDGKKKKKERSELKIKILGKDKLHKKDAKAKSSPKRLKTLGASIEIADQPENEKSDVFPSFESHTKLQGDQLALDANTQIISSESPRIISDKSVTTQIEMSVPKVELDVSDVALIQKSPQKHEEKTKKGKDIKQKQDTKTGPTFKLPKIGFSDIATEETIQKVNLNVEECPTKIEQLTAEGSDVKEDPYERLSKSSLSRTKLPKREDIEIPGMEDVSMGATAKRIKEPKAVSTGHYEEIQAETVQLSIDVDSVKEAVSKLPGFKLPKVDTSGVPIPEEITVIDANAQRISVKTPTKVVDTKTKHEAHFIKFDITASPEISKTTVKLPKITPADLTSEECLTETMADLKNPEKKYKTEAKQSDKEIKTEVYEREHIIIPGKESAILQAQETEKTQGKEGIKSEYESAATLSSKESDKKSKKARITTPSFGIAKPDIKIPDIGIDLPKQNISEQKGDNIKEERTIFLQEACQMSKTETRRVTGQIGGVISDVKIPEIDSIEYIDSVGASPAKKDGGIKLTGFGVNIDATKPKGDIFPEISGEIKVVDAEEHTIKLPKFGDISVNVPDADKDINIDGGEIKTLEREGKGSKFKMPNLSISMPKVKGPKSDLSLSKKHVDVTLPEAKAEVKLPEVPEVDVTLGNVDERPELEIRPLQTEHELDGQGSKFKMPKFGITMPKLKGPEFDLSLSKKDIDVTLPEAKAEVKLPEAREIDVTLGRIDVSIPEQKMEVKKTEFEIKPLQTETELDGQGSKFKMPKLGIAMPKVKGPEVDLSFSKKDGDVPEAKANIKIPEDENISVDMKQPESEAEMDVQGSKFKMPKFGITMPKLKGPEFDFSLSKKDVDLTRPEAKAEVKLPDVELKEPSAEVEIKAPEIKVATKDTEGSPSKFKMPTFKLPKFGVGTPSATVEVPDKDIKIDGGDIKFHEEVFAVDITAPSIDTEGPSVDMKTIGTEHEEKGSKFKMPHLGFSLPKVKGPQIDLSLAKKDVDVTLPEANAQVKLPEAPKVNVDLGKADVSLPEVKLEVKKPELEIKPLHSEVELDEQGSKFKMPKLGMSMPKVKGPEIHFSLSKKDGDVTLPEATAEVQVPEVELKEPSAKVEIKAPEIKVAAKGREGSPSKFKMPTFKLPKFGVGTPNVSVEVPDMDKDVKIDGADINIPEEGSVVKIAAPSIDIEGPSIDMKTTGTEQDGKGRKFKMPHLGFSTSKVKGPKIDLTLSKKDVDVTLPEAKADVKLPEVDLGKVDVSIPETKIEVKKPELEMHSEGELDGQGEKLKMPKFGIKMPKAKGPEIDLSLSKKDVDVTLPKGKLPDAPKIDVSIGKAEVLIPEAEVKKPELEIKPLKTEVEGQGSKFKMPKFGMSMPKVKGPEFHLGISKKDVDVTLQKAKADVNLSDVELKEPSAKVEIKAPEIEVVAKDTKGSPSKFKMPNFSFSMPRVKGPDVDLSLSKKDTDITLSGTEAEVKLPEAPKIDASLGKTEVLIPEAKVEVKKPEVEIKPLQTDIELEGQGGKSKRFGITMPKVKGPEFDLNFSKKDVDVTLPEAKAEVKLPETPKIAVDMKPPECEAEIDAQGSKFKMPKFGITMPKVKGPEIDLNFSKKDVDVTLPEARAEVKLPETPKIAVDMKPPECEAEIDGQGSKFKMPKFGMSMPKVKGPEIDFTLSKKDVDITLPEAKAEVNLPDVELKEPSAEVEIKAPEIEAQLSSVKGSPSKFKLPTFKFPKFGIATPNVSAEVPDIDKEIKIDGADMHISVPHTDVDVPEVKAKVHLPDINVKEPSGGVVIEQQPGVEVDAKLKKSRFSLPRFSFSKPSVKAPEVDVSLQHANVANPEGKVEVQGEGVDIKLPECEAEIDAQGSKFKMPKFGITMPKVKGPEFDLSLSKKEVDVTLPEGKTEVELPEAPKIAVDMKPPECEAEIDAQGSKFKMPKFGITMPKVKGPEFDLSLSKKEVDVTLPEGKTEVELPEAPKIAVDMKPPECEAEIDAQGSKFKMPKFGITMPKVKGPEFDLSFSKKDVDLTLPEAKAEVMLPDVELKEPSAEVKIKAPEIKVVTKDTEGSPSKFKMPTFKLPKFGVGTPSATIEVPNADKDLKIDGDDVKIPEEVLAVDIAAPSMDIKGPSIDMKTTETEHAGKGSKFKMPKFGITMPKVTGPEIDLSLSKKNVDVTLPEAKAEVKLPDVELKEPSAEVKIKAPEIKVATKDTEGSPSKFKMPTFKFPTFGVGPPSATVEVSNVDKDVKIDGDEIKIPEEVLAVDIAAPCIDTEGPSIDMKTTETEHAGKGSKFKMPKFGITMPKVTGPEIDLSLSKKNVDVTLPEAKAEVKLPDVEVKEPSAEVKMKAPEIKVATKDREGSPSKFKMPTFKLPKFGIGTPSATVEVPDTCKDVKIDEADITFHEEVLAVDITAPSIDTEGPSIDIKTTGTEHEGKGSKFKMPSLGFSVPQVKQPDIDLSVSKKDLDVTLPEAKTKVQLPGVEVKESSAKVEIKAPGINVQTSNVEGSPSTFKMPTFKLPRFGSATPQVSGEVPDKDIKVDGADLKLPQTKAEVKLPEVDIKKPVGSISVSQAPTTEGDAKLKKTTRSLPRFSFSKTSVEAPEVDVNLDVPKVDVTLPEAKTDLHLPDIDIKESSGISIEGAPATDLDAKLKKPRFSLPKFSFSKQSTKEPEVDVSLPDVDVSLPEGNVEVKQPNMELKPPEGDAELDGQESKFKMPKFGISMPKVKGPEIDLSLSKKDIDVTLPEAKAEVQLPDVKIKQPSAKVEIKAPEIEARTGHVEGSPSKLKMPTFTLPKFGAATPKVSVEVPDVDKDIKIDGAKLEVPKEGATVDVTAPSIDTEGLSIDVKAKGSELEGSGSKFKMPKFGISMPKVKGPEIDLSLSKKDIDVTIPEAKAEVQLPDVKIKQPSAKVEIKAPEIEARTGHVEGSPSKLKMPTFTLPKFGAATPKVSVEVPDVDKDIKTDGAKLEVPKEGATVDVTAPSIDTEGLSVDVKAKGSELEGSGSKFKMPKFGISMPKVKGPEIDLSLSKKDVDVTLPKARAEVKLPDVEVKEPEGDISEPDVPTVEVEAKLKRPSWTFPKFSFSRTGGGKAPDADVNLETPKADVTSPETKTEISLPDVEVKGPSGAISMEEPPTTDLDANLKKTKFSLPKFSVSKSSVKEPEVSAELPNVDVSLPGDNVEVKQPDLELKSPESDVKLDGQESKFKMPKFGISMPKIKGPEIDLSLSKKDVDVTLPEAKAEVQLPDVKIKQPSAKVEIKAPEIEARTGHVEGSPSKLKMPTFTLPKFGAATPKVSVEVPDVDKDIKTDGAKLEVPKEGATVDVTAPSIDTEGLSVDVKAKGSELEGSGSKFKMPKFGISMPKVKGPEIDLSLSKKDIDVTLPEAKAEVQLPDVKIKQPSAKVEIKAPEIEAEKGHVEGSPSKLKMPTFTLPKFGAATPKVSVEVPDVDKDIKTDGAKLEVPKEGATVDVTAPSIDTEGLSVDVKAKGSELEGSGSKFKMPKFGISMPKVKGPEIDLSLSKKDVDVTLPEAKAEVKLPDTEVKEPEGTISIPDVPTVEVEAKLKRPNWTFPKFSFSRTGGKAPDVDVNLETPKADITSPEGKAEVCLPDVEVQGPSGAISMEEPPAADFDANLKKTKFLLPRFSFSKSSVKEPEVSAKLSPVDVSLPEGEVKVKQPDMEIKAPEFDTEHDGQGSKFKLPKFGIALPKAKGPEEDLNASQKDVDITLPGVKAEVKLPEIEVKESSASGEIKASETEAKSEDVGGSPLKFKMPTVKMPKFGGATYVTVEAPDADKVAETDGDKLKEDVTVNIKGLSVDIKTDVSKAAITDSETPQTETDSVGLGSPSKFKLPSFKMPKLSFSRPKPEEEYVPVESECKKDQLEMEVEPKRESKSPKMALTSFGEILKNVDVEFDVPKVEEHLETSKKVNETVEPSGKQLETKEKETNTKQDTIKSPERTGWFKFPKFGLSSPSEPAKISEKDEHKDEKSSVGETVDEEISPTCSVQSSDAFADISSAMTSEHVGLSLSSPTKVTVKYSDPNAATGLGEIHSNIITSTTRTELISVEPNLPEKITILSSGVSSSSEDTLRLESGKIHVITSNIQATPEAQHAKLLTSVQVQSAGGPPLKSEANEATSWTVEDSQSSKRTVFERHLVRETSSERSESKETIVITKQITHTFDSSVSGETASSIQRLRDSVHSEKMRFFDGAEK